MINKYLKVNQRKLKNQRKMENVNSNLIPNKKVKLIKSYSNYQGTIPMGDYVTIEEVKSDGTVRILDLFGKPWVLPVEYLKS
jgi:hypothetical protein